MMLPTLDLLGREKFPPLPARGRVATKPIRVQPVLTYETPRRREKTSWPSWGGIQTDEDAKAEQARITEELTKLKQQADFPLDLLPVLTVKSLEEAKRIAAGDHDTMLVYGAGGDGRTWRL